MSTLKKISSALITATLTCALFPSIAHAEDSCVGKNEVSEETIVGAGLGNGNLRVKHGYLDSCGAKELAEGLRTPDQLRNLLAAGAGAAGKLAPIIEISLAAGFLEQDWTYEQIKECSEDFTKGIKFVDPSYAGVITCSGQ